MAVGDDNKLDTTKGTKKKKKGTLSLKIVLIFFLILGIIAGGAFTGYYFLFAEKPGEIEKSGLPKEILEFTFLLMPQVHAGLISISDEMVITEKEINRIKEIEKNYPAQEKITTSEKRVWDKNFSVLTKFLEKHEKEIQNLYVSYRVNQETGQKLIDENKEALAKASNEIIAPSKVLTDKIRVIEDAKSLLDKVKDYIG